MLIFSVLQNIKIRFSLSVSARREIKLRIDVLDLTLHPITHLGYFDFKIFFVIEVCLLPCKLQPFSQFLLLK